MVDESSSGGAKRPGSVHYLSRPACCPKLVKKASLFVKIQQFEVLCYYKVIWVPRTVRRIPTPAGRPLIY